MEEHEAVGNADQMIAAAAAGDWKILENLWLERLEAGAWDPSHFLEAGRILAAGGQGERLVAVASVTCPAFNEAGRHDDAFALARVAASTGVEDSDLARAALDAARVIHSSHSAAEQLLHRIDLEIGKGLSHVILLADSFFRFDVGTLVKHSGGWGIGEVKELRARREEMEVLFENGRSHVFPIRSAGEYLDPIPAGRIDALVRKNPVMLREEAEKDPLKTISRAVDFGCGSIDSKDLKSLLVPAVFDPESWNSWWGSARARIKKSPEFDMTGAPNLTVRRREAPLSCVDDFTAQFANAGGFWDRLKVLRQYLKTEARGKTDAGFVQSSMAALRSGASTAPQKAALAFLAQDTGMEAVDEARALAGILSSTGREIASAAAEIEPADYKGRLVDEYKRAAGDGWTDRFSDMLFEGDAAVWDHAVKALVEAGRSDLAAARVSTLLGAPNKHPRAFYWLAKKSFEGKIPDTLGVPDITTLVDALLGVLHAARTDRLAEGRENRDLLNKGRAILTEDVLRRAFADVTESVAKRLWHRVSVAGLSQIFMYRAEKVVAAVHPEVVASAQSEEQPEEERSIWTTAAGLARRKSEYERLLNVEFPKNAEDLGRAIAMGDLSENAEYDAARERQRHLVEAANRMEEELNRARIIDPAMLIDGEAGVGTTVKVQDAEGRAVSYSLLGPWDADPEKGIISYMSPVGKALRKAKPGQEVVVKLPDGEKTLKILEVAIAPQILEPKS